MADWEPQSMSRKIHSDWNAVDVHNRRLRPKVQSYNAKNTSITVHATKYFMIRNTPYFHVWNSHADHGDHIVGLQDFTTKMSEHAKSMIGYGSNSWTSSYSYHIIVDLKRQNRLKVGIDTPNTPVTPGLRPYCDQFFDQIALDRSKVSLWSHYDLPTRLSIDTLL